jgi:hypothetical protein
MRRLFGISMLALTLAALAPGATAALISRVFEFKPGVTLEVGASTDDGMRLDSVRFQLPSAGDGSFRSGGLATATVAVSNTTEASSKVGIAIALFDEGGKLVGVASGGTKLTSIKGDRQKSFTLVFDHVNDAAFKTKTFQITLESKP